MKDKIIEYDYVRAVAIILVIIGHCYSNTIVYGPYGGDVGEMGGSPMLGTLHFITNIIYSFHMPLFMALSGSIFNVAIKKNGILPFKTFVTNKSHRLLLPFILVSLFWNIPLKYISGYWHAPMPDVLYQIIVGQIFLMGGSHLWFLEVLFIIFILAWVIEKYNLRRNTFLFFVVLFVISFGREMYSEEIGRCVFCLELVMYLLIWFYCGFYFEKYREKINKAIDCRVNWDITIWALILIPLLVAVNYRIPHIFRIDLLLSYFITTYSLFVVYLFCYKAKITATAKASRIIEKLSKNSYGLYLFSDGMNYLIIAFTIHYSLQDCYADNLFTLGVYLTRLVASFCLAWLITEALNRFNKKHNCRLIC